MENANLLVGETNEELISETFNIKKEDVEYKLNIELNNENIRLQIFEENLFDHLYEKTLDFEGIKALDNIFSKFNSCQELLNYIKAKKKHNFLEISKITNNRIDIILEKDNIEINLFKIKASPELIMKILFEEILNLKTNFKIFEINKEIIDEETNFINEKNENLIKENKNILKNIKNLEEENTKIKEENSKKKRG